jgi:hypothetical protein
VFDRRVGRVELGEAEPGAAKVGADWSARLIVGHAVLGARVAIVAVLVFAGALGEEIARVGNGARGAVVGKVGAVGVGLAQ